MRGETRRGGRSANIAISSFPAARPGRRFNAFRPISAVAAVKNAIVAGMPSPTSDPDIIGFPCRCTSHVRIVSLASAPPLGGEANARLARGENTRRSENLKFQVHPFNGPSRSRVAIEAARARDYDARFRKTRRAGGRAAGGKDPLAGFAMRLAVRFDLFPASRLHRRIAEMTENLWRQALPSALVPDSPARHYS